jgi:hypothetical protein
VSTLTEVAPAARFVSSVCSRLSLPEDFAVTVGLDEPVIVELTRATLMSRPDHFTVRVTFLMPAAGEATVGFPIVADAGLLPLGQVATIANAIATSRKPSPHLARHTAASNMVV